MLIFHLLLLFRVGGCTDDLVFQTNTVVVGDYVNLTCTRRTTDYEVELYWIRLVSGKLPEFLGGTFSFDFARANETPQHQTPRIIAKQEPGTFVLIISKTELSDTGLYYCIKVDQLDMRFSKGIFLKVKGPEPDITAVIQDSVSDPVHPGDSVTLQCSVLSDSNSKMCPGDHSVYWFRAGSDSSHPSLIYTHGNSDDQCEKSPEARSPQKCVYSFSKNISSSDAGTYYCAVTTCGQILFGNGTNLKTEALWDLQMDNIVLLLLCAALAISLIVIGFLIYNIKKKTSSTCNAAVALQTDAATASGNQRHQQRDEDSLAYSAPSFTRKKAEKTGRGNTKRKNTVYTDVNCSEIELKSKQWI
ncbi:uncharacterized protein LOC113160096 [Anabas testudineus]|uniref:Ig-like domain-containing protein n=1 Tax=Anabas testudineus TaxID=64144 RepID=A0A3Q1IFU0_ANATE|nr:uncharacterized protein LOC113160096 [Anabas testudineus]